MDMTCRPVFSRGSGLGNRLFPWARCKLFARKSGARMLAPRWLNLRLGPIARGDVLLLHWRRQILLQGLFKPLEDEITGLPRIVAEFVSRRVPEDQTASLRKEEAWRPRLVEFAGDRRHFLDLVGEEAWLLSSLREMTRDRWLSLAGTKEVPAIALNVRCAKDFPEARTVDMVHPRGPVRTPIGWFRAVLRQIRKTSGHDVPAVVVSDGSTEELEDLLREPRVSLLRPGCAISDLLVLSSARVLIASGGSSFGAWASFLGGMPTVTLPGQSYSWFKLPATPGQFVGTFDLSAPDPEFLRSAAFAIDRGGRCGSTTFR